MKRIIKALNSIFLILGIAAFCLSASPESTNATQSSSSNSSSTDSKAEYYIDDYEIEINIREDNVYDITENYSVIFNKSNSHGIYRKIPKQIKGWRADGSVFRASALISNVSVEGDEWTHESTTSDYSIKIGNKHVTLPQYSQKDYTIKYRYDYGQDKLSGGDEFYFNLIGLGWDENVVFGRTRFTINFPKKFKYNSDTIGFTVGRANNSNVAKAQYDVSGKTIRGYYSEEIRGGKAFTVRVVLPEGYYIGAREDSYSYGYAALAVSATSLLICCITFLCIGRDKKLKTTAVYDPPQELNPFQFGMLSGSSVSMALIGLIIHMAEKGYLLIDCPEKGKSFTITKVKDYEGGDASEKVLMQELFSYSKDGKNVTDKDIEKDFYKSVQKIINAADIKGLQKRCYKMKNSIIATVYIVVNTILWALCIALISAQTSYTSSTKSDLISVAALILIPLAIIVSFFIRRRTQYGDDLISRIRSYKNTIKQTGVLSGQGASYFYYNYAYAYAIGLGSAFSKKFLTFVNSSSSV